MKIVKKKMPVPSDLSAYAECFWYAACLGDATETSPLQTCLPNGTAELIFHLAPARHSIQTDGQWIEMPEMFLTSVTFAPVHWVAPGGTVMFGINLLPETVELIFGQPVGLLDGLFADAHQFGSARLDDLATQLRAATTDEERYQLAVGFLRERLHHANNKTSSQPSYLVEALRHLRSNATSLVSIESLSEQVFVCKRQLQRAFQHRLGVSPKVYGRIVRFRHAFLYLQANPGVKMADVTYDFGYADQSHFIREFREFSGSHPRAFLSRGATVN